VPTQAQQNLTNMLRTPHSSGDAVGVHTGWRSDVEGIREAHEEVEERTVVDCLRDLRIRPSNIAQDLNLFIGDAVGMACQRADKFQQQPLCPGDRGAVQVAIPKGLGGVRVLLALQLQEPCMATQSIMTGIERRYIGRNHIVLGTA
jgi:hypothetical protein